MTVHVGFETWLQGCIEDMNAARAPEQKPEPRPIEDRARAYSHRVNNWLDAGGGQAGRDPGGPRKVVACDAAYIPAMIESGVGGRSQALAAIARSREAWIQMSGHGMVTIQDAERFVADLSCLADELAQPA